MQYIKWKSIQGSTPTYAKIILNTGNAQIKKIQMQVKVLIFDILEGNFPVFRIYGLINKIALVRFVIKTSR